MSEVTMHSLRQQIINKKDPHFIITQQFGLPTKQKGESLANQAPVQTTLVGGKLSKVAHEPIDGIEPLILGGSDPTAKHKGLTIKQILKNLQSDVKQVEEENYQIIKEQNEEKQKKLAAARVYGAHVLKQSQSV